MISWQEKNKKAEKVECILFLFKSSKGKREDNFFFPREKEHKLSHANVKTQFWRYLVLLPQVGKYE